MKKASLLFLAVIGLASCRSIENEATNAQLSVSMSEKDNKAMVPIEYVDTIDLHYPDSVTLGSVSRVYATDDMLIIVDNMSQPYGFTHRGEYVCRYGSKGEAPTEFINMSACAVHKDEVVICDSYTQRMLFYNLYTGQFNRYVAFPKGALNMVQQCVFLSDSTAMLARYVYNDNNSVYAIADIADKKVTDFASVPMKTDNVAMPIGWHAISSYKDTAVYIKPFSPYIYQYPETEWIYIEQPKRIYDDDELASINDFSIMTYAKAMYGDTFAGFTDIYELEDWIFLALQDVEFYLINKHSWEMNQYKYTKDDSMDYQSITKIIGAISQNNVLIGVNNQAGDEDKVYLYHLSTN